MADAAPVAFNFKQAITNMVQRNGSDLLLKVGRPATIRVNGDLVGLDTNPLKPEELKSLAEQIMTPRQVKEFAEHKEADFAIGVPGVGRFRTNVYQQRGTVAFAFRAIPYEVKQIKELSLPPVMEEIALKPRGLVLVTGVTGSGKSTALAAMINHVNTNRRVNIITIEDPIEFLHRDQLANISQREVGNDTLSFNSALRHVLRQDPDVILIGEMRDVETAQIGLRAAITGHMVLSTLHTRDAASAPLRLVDMGVPRYMVAYSLQAVVAQRLLRLNCESCSKPHQPDPRETQWLRSAGGDPGAGRILAGAGCPHCNGSGYAGRTGIYEMLEMDGELAALANSDDPGRFIAAAEQRMAGRLLQDSAVQLALAGKTTISEAMRVTAQVED